MSCGLGQTEANSMVSNASIIKKIYFPRLIIPVSSILVSLFDFLMAFILFFECSTDSPKTVGLPSTHKQK